MVQDSARFVLHRFGPTVGASAGTEARWIVDLVQRYPRPYDSHSSATQVAAVVPYAMEKLSSAHVLVTFGGQTSGATDVAVAATSPGIFTLDSSGKGQAASVNQDGKLNRKGSGAKAGSIISLFETGEGQTLPLGIDGKPATPPFPQPILEVTVTIGGQSALVQYAGGAPGATAGLMQINAEIPAGLLPGDATPVVVGIGSQASQPSVSIAVE